MPTFHRTISICGHIAASVGLLACADEAEVEDTCAWVLSPDECKRGDEHGDTGEFFAEPDGANEGPKAWDLVCLTEPNGHTKFLHHCGGEISVTLAFNTPLGDCGETLGDDDLCTEVHHFGPGHDSETSPAVMACCDVHDPDHPNAEQHQETYLQYCAADSVEQICRSLPLRLQKYIDDGRLGLGKNQAQKLQSWLAKEKNLQACYDTLYNVTDVPGKLDAAVWKVNGGNNDQWRLLDGFQVRLDYSNVEVVELANGPIECIDNNLNNTEVFERPQPPSELGPTELAYPVEAEISGPEVFGGGTKGVVPVRASAPTSADPGVDPDNAWGSETSSLTLNPSELGWTLAELELVADGPAVLGNDAVRLEIERAKVRLFGTSVGTPAPGTERVVFEPHTAGFVISGVSAGVYALRWASNATPIVASWTEREWILDEFELEHVDGQGRRWTIHIPSTTWSTPRL